MKLTRYEVPTNEYLPEREAGRFVLVKELIAESAKIAQAVAEKMCGCDPAYCLCDGLHTSEEVKNEILRQLTLR